MCRFTVARSCGEAGCEHGRADHGAASNGSRVGLRCVCHGNDDAGHP
jgi:hypothetical protein